MACGAVRRCGLGLSAVALGIAGLGCDVGLDGKSFDLVTGGSSASAGGAPPGSTGATGTGTGAAGGAGGGAATTTTATGVTTGTGGATSTGSTSTGTGGGGGGPCDALGDEFNDPATDACWTRRHVQEMSMPDFTAFDISTTVPGHLVIRPTAQAAFWQDTVGPYLFKNVTGNFLVVARVLAGHVADVLMPPAGNYHAAGLLVRTQVPALDLSEVDEHWVKWEVGRIDGAIGVGTLGGATEMSASVHLQPSTNNEPPFHEADLAICRVGDELRLFRRRIGGAWESIYAIDPADPGVPDLPDTAQVGLMASSYLGQPADVDARFDWVRFADPPPSTAVDCSVGLSAVPP